MLARRRCRHEQGECNADDDHDNADDHGHGCPDHHHGHGITHEHGHNYVDDKHGGDSNNKLTCSCNVASTDCVLMSSILAVPRPDGIVILPIAVSGLVDLL